MRVLVVDDEPGMRLGVVRTLRGFTVHVPDVHVEAAFTVDQAETGEEALEKIQQQPPHILLLDYKLPGISGLDVLERVPSIDPDIQTVIITAYASLDTAITATKKGACDFLAKPFTPQELRYTVRKTTENLILARQARKLAQEKRRVRFEFISVLAHELKAPLSAIEGYLHIVKDRTAGDDPAVYDRMLERCLVRTEHMRKLIVDLLDLTRIESGQKTRELAEVDVCEVARTAIDTLLPSAQERNIAIELHADGPVTMTADKGEIEIILNNLISNAVKYNRDNGRVDVEIKKQNGQVIIRVADTGIGMTKEDAEKLFNEFVRIKNEKTRHILGSGLGLSIVKKLAMLYGGNVSVESEPDVGSTFTVVLKENKEEQET